MSQKVPSQTTTFEVNTIQNDVIENESKLQQSYIDNTICHENCNLLCMDLKYKIYVFFKFYNCIGHNKN